MVTLLIHGVRLSRMRSQARTVGVAGWPGVSLCWCCVWQLVKRSGECSAVNYRVCAKLGMLLDLSEVV